VGTLAGNRRSTRHCDLVDRLFSGKYVWWGTKKKKTIEGLVNLSEYNTLHNDSAVKQVDDAIYEIYENATQVYTVCSGGFPASSLP